jgi:hypothetical protein
MKNEAKKGAGRPALYSQKMRRVNVMLDDETIAFYSTQGANLSEGIRKAWRGITPVAANMAPPPLTEEALQILEQCFPYVREN